MQWNRFATGVTIALALGGTGPGAFAQWHHEASMLRPEVGVENLGRAIAIDGEVAVIGCGADQHEGPSVEAAFVYRFDGDEWIEEAMLVAHDGALGNRFGTSVAISGDVIVVGAWGDDEVGTDAGSAYVFQWNEAARTWSFDEKLTAPTPGESAHFGWAVATNGTFVFVGAPGHDANVHEQPRIDTGALYCFALESAMLPDDGLIWVARESWYGQETGDRLGVAVAMRDRVGVAGMPGAMDGAGLAMTLWARTDGTWATGTIAASDGHQGAGFGLAVGTDGQRVIVGAPAHLHVHGELHPLVAAGGAYVFGYDGAWIEQTELQPPQGGADGDEFGAAVGIDDALATVGAPGDDRGAPGAGAGYLFRFNTLAWMLDHEMIPEAADEAFGAAIGVHGTVCIVGSPHCDNGTFRSGLVTVHRCAYVLGETFLSRTGHAVSCTGDLDDDGFDDLLVGSPFHADGDGRLYVFSGRTREELYTRDGSDGEGFGWDVAGIGDVDGDGFEDYIVGAPFRQDERGRAKVFSGRDGTRLFTKRGEAPGDRFGWSVAGGIDVDADGALDVLVGAPRNEDAGHMAGKVYVYDGRTGSEIGTIIARQHGERFGYAIAALGRANGDRFGDFVVGAPHYNGRLYHAGRVYVISGRTFDPLYAIDGRQRKARFGRAVATVGLADDDGHPDFGVGSPTFDRGDRPNAGRVDVFSGKDGTRLWVRRGKTAGDCLGHVLAGIPDVDGDGHDDLLVGAPRHDGNGRNSGRSYLFGGADGALLGVFTGERPFDFSGYALGCVRDLDHDGGYEALVAAPYGDASAPRAGKVQVLMSTAGSGAAPLQDPVEPEALSPDAVASLDFGDGDAADIVTVLAQWGDCDACETDVNGDGNVDATDLISLIRDIDW